VAASNQDRKLDKGTLLGLVLAVGGICGGLLLEGGSMREIAQPTAALIVFGGTLGATLVSQPFRVFRDACRKLARIVFEERLDPHSVLAQIVEFSNKARRKGIVSLEKEIMAVADPFLKKALILAVDGTEPQEIRRMMELEIALDESRADAEAGVWESAGGYAPTIGIIGAVLGLIQVMKHLENIEEVGKGIAVAFVATIYGVGVANLFLLPAAAKMKSVARARQRISELALEGVIGIAEGLNPKLIQNKLEAYLDNEPAARPKKAPPAPPDAAAAA